jgi:hypothetical protein
MISKIWFYARIFLCVAIFINILLICFNPIVSLKMVGILCAMVSFLVIDNSLQLDKICWLEGIIRDMKVVEYQDRILAEVKNNNVQTTKFITEQTDLLIKMTTLAARKNSDPPNSPN